MHITVFSLNRPFIFTSIEYAVHLNSSMLTKQFRYLGLVSVEVLRGCCLQILLKNSLRISKRRKPTPYLVCLSALDSPTSLSPPTTYQDEEISAYEGKFNLFFFIFHSPTSRSCRRSHRQRNDDLKGF